MTGTFGVRLRELLRELRRECELTQQQLADKAGLPLALISRLELGRQHGLQPQAAAALAAVLRVPVADLAGVPVCQGCQRAAR